MYVVVMKYFHMFQAFPQLCQIREASQAQNFYNSMSIYGMIQ